MCGQTTSLQKPVVELTADEFRSRFLTLLAQAPPADIASASFFWIPANQPPWFDTGIDLANGEELSIVAAGRVVLSRELDITFHPDIQLWYRVSEGGKVFRGTRNSHTVRTQTPGRLFFGNYFPGQWSTRTGATFVGTDAYKTMEGGLAVMVLRWTVPALQGLKRLRAAGDIESLLASEIDRLENPVATPVGWDYLWFLGASEIFSVAATTGSRNHISCTTHRDAAILHKDVSVPLAPGTTLKWTWKVDALPCQQAEDALQNHDYLSIAVEFDNGQDLTFPWSSQLSVDTGFRCPIPSWTAREMHVVARSGEQELGNWCTDERDLYAYYERFIGTIGRADPTEDPRVVAPPTRVVRVWLIANSMFRQRTGKCEYGAIELHSGDEVTVVN
jgi:hypothetical protein